MSALNMNESFNAVPRDIGVIDPNLPSRRVLSMPGRFAERLVRDVTSSGGTVWLRIVGTSMAPTIRHGDCVLLEASRRAPRRGDVVLVQGARGLILHRVIQVRGGSVLTRGDACTATDPPVRAEEIIALTEVARRGDTLFALRPTLRFGNAALAGFARLALRRLVRQVRGFASALVRRSRV
jgi:peptidase S24-like protein